MNAQVRLTPADIRKARADNSKMRERDLAGQLGISEAEFVAAFLGETVTRIEPRVSDLLGGLEAVGEVMALTRNESAVHEKIGVYDKVVTGEFNAMVLGADIDLRIFPQRWAHGFSVEKRDGETVRRSLQFFDAAGQAVHKIHLREASNLQAFEALVASLVSDDQSPMAPLPTMNGESKIVEISADPVDVASLRERWSGLTDVHQFFGMLTALKIDRQAAVRHVGRDFAWQLNAGSVKAMFDDAVTGAIPIMCFVSNKGCIQIHSGPVHTIKEMGPWLNVMDETFHLHLRQDHISELWAVRKPTKDGHVTSIEAYNKDGELFIQFFGKRHEGEGERADWRALVEALLAVDQVDAA
ncbi:hemin-degrading factor [Mesorhizobium sp. NBSH29]|uniref:hemin-degrading factor n=1 Tax=Mesorhizobium sp. NBSH29 TaxID=2654249 RepID=UPI00189672E5|nr:ChuX/HutX family heme-like substrate-binding protein [Mesorhizobium sp. NBSH29]QPC85842.1 hemin-degrading factor [Mesorhizobium sp. NBSH29]